MLADCIIQLVPSSRGPLQALSAAIELSAVTSVRLLGLVLMSTSSRVSSRAREMWRQSAQAALERGDEVAAKVQVMVAETQVEKEMPKLSDSAEPQQLELPEVAQ